MLTMVFTGHHTMLLQYYRYIPYAVLFILLTYLFYTWNFVPLNALYLFSYPPNTIPSAAMKFVLCGFLLFLFFCLFSRFVF